MKKVVFVISLLFGMSVMITSCEKEGVQSSSLDGDYVCQKVEILFTNGQSKTITDKEDWIRRDVYSFDFEESDYILFDYEYYFSSGEFKYKTDYTDRLKDGGSYSVKNKTLSLGFLGIEATAYKIVSNSGSTLVLEASEDYIKLANFNNEILGAPCSIKKTTATYKRQ